MDTCDNPRYQCQKGNPPQNACELTLEFMESAEPITLSEMQEYMVSHKNEENNPDGYMNPDSCQPSAMGGFQVNAGCGDSGGKEKKTPIASLEFCNLIHNLIQDFLNSDCKVI